MAAGVLPYRGIWPRIGPRVFIAPGAAVIGDVELTEWDSWPERDAGKGNGADDKAGTEAPPQRPGQPKEMNRDQKKMCNVLKSLAVSVVMRIGHATARRRFSALTVIWKPLKLCQKRGALMEEAARAIVEEIRAHKRACPETIYLVDTDAEMVDTFEDALRNAVQNL